MHPLDDMVFDSFSEVAASLSVPIGAALYWYKELADPSWPTIKEIERKAKESARSEWPATRSTTAAGRFNPI